MITWLLSNAAMAMILAVIAIAIIRMFRPGPAVRHALWLVVLLKLIAPSEFLGSLQLPIEAPKVTFAQEQKIVESSSVENPYGEEEIFTVWLTPAEMTQYQSRSEIVEVGFEAESTPEISTVQPVNSTETQTSSSSIDPMLIILGCWLIGAMVIFWRQLRDTWRFARFAARARKADDLIIGEVAVVANRMNVRMPKVRELDGLASPVIWSLWSPVLLWPSRLNRRLSEEGRKAVIAHELAHLRRRDHWVRRLEMIAAVLHWWNPVFWLARHGMRTNAELACDAWAANQTDRRAFAEALLEVCSLKPRCRPAPAVGVFGEGRRAMQERLTMIMKDRASGRLAFSAKLLVTLMMLAALPAWTLGQSKPVEVIVETKGSPEAKAIEEQIANLTKKLAELKAQKATEKVKGTVNLGDSIKGHIQELIFTEIGDAIKEIKPEQQQKVLSVIKKIQEQPGASGKAVNVTGQPVQAITITGQPLVAGQNINVAGKPAESGQAFTFSGQVVEAGKPATSTVHATVGTAHGANVKVISAGEGGVKVIGSDGREIKNAKVIIIDEKSAATSNTGHILLKTLETKGQNALIAAQPSPSAHAVNVTGAPGKNVTVTVKPSQISTTAPATGHFIWAGEPVKSTTTTTSETKIARTLTATGRLSGNESTAITLSRMTYKLSKDQAASLASLLSTIKAVVMETKLEGESLTVTTTPEAQASVTSMVGLITGQPKRVEIRMITPPAATPAVQPKPSTPGKGGTTFSTSGGELFLAVPAAPVAPTAPASKPTNEATIEFIVDTEKTAPAPKSPVSKPGAEELKKEIKELRLKLVPSTKPSEKPPESTSDKKNLHFD